MARKTASRLQKRREVEAAEVQDKKVAKKKAPAAKKPARKKVKAAERKRLIWGVFSASLKEEGRFPYDQRAQAEEKAEQLHQKTKRTYFVQPIKELITGPPAKPATAEEEE